MKMYEYPKEGDLKEIKIELTKSCLLSCIHCSSNASLANSVQLSIETVLSLINQAAAMQVKSITFSGGEPLLWPWIKDAVSSCNALGLDCSLYTSGINLSENGAKEIIGLNKQGLGKVTFSLYSAVISAHEEVTRKFGSYDKTISVIKALNNIKIEKEINFIPLKINYKEFGKLIELSESMGISRVNVLRFVPQGRGIILKNGREVLMQTETMELRNLILHYRANFNVDIGLGSPYNILILNHDTECRAAREILCIGPNGNIYPCDAFKNIEPDEIGLDDPYNNIIEHNLKECWEKSKYLNSIRHYLTTPFEEPCSKCLYLERCKSGCLAQKVIKQESIEDGKIGKRADPLCIRNLIGGSDASYR
jgi:radical SAM protein with 4Fe4S-binding SPASM domain